MKILIALVLVIGAAGPAAAQYYERPPPGYYPAPERYPPPPPYRRVPFGRQCDAMLETPYGPRQLVCPIREAKPLGEPCACPPPRGSGYGGRFVGGTTVR